MGRRRSIEGAEDNPMDPGSEVEDIRNDKSRKPGASANSF